MPKWFVDITMAYPPNQRFPNLNDIFLGRKLGVMDINFYYRVYRFSDVPFHDLGELTKWMYNLYYEKEAMLSYFYQYGRFPNDIQHSLCGILKHDGSELKYSWKYYAKLHVLFIFSYVFLSLAFAFALRFIFYLFIRIFRGQPTPMVTH